MLKGIKVAIIGAGASGMMAAIAAAKKGAEVTIYEKNDRVGKKILMTGNGKCNLGNLDCDISKYYCSHPESVEGIINKFTVYDTISFFESAGAIIKEKGGYLYPASEQASTILDILRMELEEHNIRICCDCEVTGIENNSQFGFCVTTGTGQEMYDKLIIACGSNASLRKTEIVNGYKLAQSLHHSVIPVVPALVQLKCSEKFMKALAGVRCQAGLTLMIDGTIKQKEFGELQLTEYGISGIPVFQFSREAAYGLSDKKEVTVNIDFLPDYEKETFTYFAKNRFENASHKNLEDFLLGIANKKINQVIMKNAGYRGSDKAADLGEKTILQILYGYKNLLVHITDTNSFENAQVCAGGVSMREVNRHLESIFIPGLYFTGELLDVDGRCGGYNLQWAWASGYVAGSHAAGEA